METNKVLDTTQIFLYGASIQGIQAFIFQTKELEEVMGASAIVEQICTEKFKSVLKDHKKELPNPEDSKLSSDQIIIAAAGNIKLLLNKAQCTLLVKYFPKEVMMMAPGITISQAVVAPEEGKNYAEKVNLLETHLRSQRNIMPHPMEIGFMATERDRRSSGVAMYIDGKTKLGNLDVVCEATYKKRQQKDQLKNLTEKITKQNYFDDAQLNTEMEDLDNGHNSYVAFVHADGNGLGKHIQNMNKSLEGKTDEEQIEAFRTFSQELEQATQKALQRAFNDITDLHKKDEWKVWAKFPIRPIIIGGDDVTLMIKAELALPFVTAYLKYFEEETKKFTSFKKGENKKLTACAGIAYIKHKFPLHYAMALAEELCGESKLATKRLSSGLSFYKVQESYIRSLPELRKNVQLHEGVENKQNSLNHKVKDNEVKYRPYGLQVVEELTRIVNILSEQATKEQAGISKLRSWVSELNKDMERSAFVFDRFKTINASFYNKLFPQDKSNHEPTSNAQYQMLYDALQIHALSK